MTKQSGKPEWVYVVVETIEGRDVFVGYTDEASDVSYIPAFYNKEDAQDCFLHVPRVPGRKYEIQAVPFEALVRDALSNTFLIFMLDKAGTIQQKIDPATVQD